MRTKYRNSLLGAGIALAMAAAGSPAAAGTAPQEVTDARQETQIWTTYALSPYLRANDLKVAVQNGKATLTGQVDESLNKELAEQIALGVDGVKSVDNQIVVQAGYSPPARNAELSFGDKVDDASTTSAVKSRLMWSKHADGSAMKVDTQRGKVTLTGSAESKASRELAGSLASNTRGVMSVDNQLVVGDAKTSVGDAKPGMSADMADGWITTKVKSTFLYSTNVDSSDIAVSTSAGIVTLTGAVDSGAERAAAIELASNVRGVKSVQSKELTTL